MRWTIEEKRESDRLEKGRQYTSGLLKRLFIENTETVCVLVVSSPGQSPGRAIVLPPALALALGGGVGISKMLVGCFGFNGPLRQYFSLYRAEQNVKVLH